MRLVCGHSLIGFRQSDECAHSIVFGIGGNLKDERPVPAFWRTGADDLIPVLPAVLQAVVASLNDVASGEYLLHNGFAVGAIGGVRVLQKIPIDG
jgi:hypothetical protein